MNSYIFRKGRFTYVVLDGPYERARYVLGVTNTLWGARRVARRGLKPIVAPEFVEKVPVG